MEHVGSKVQCKVELMEDEVMPSACDEEDAACAHDWCEKGKERGKARKFGFCLGWEGINNKW